MARKTGNHNATNGAIEQLYREIRELRAVTEAGFSQLGADLGQLKKDQSRTERKVGSAAVLADLQFDLITWAVLLSIILLSQAYVSIARNAPRWLQNALPLPSDVEQVEPQHAAAIAPSAAPFSMAALDQSPVAVGDTIAPGLRVTSLFRPPHRPRHNGVDVGGPVGTPYFAPTAVDVRCYWDHGGGGEVAEFVVDGYRWQLLHLDRNTCVAGSHQPRAVIGKLGNTGRSTGPHLHLQIRPAGGGDFINPRRGHLQAVLVPPAPAAVVTGNPSGNGLPVGFTVGQADETVSAIFNGALNLGVTDPYQISYILATAQHESASFRTLHEFGTGGYCGSARKYDGWAGVGLVQLTWRGNFDRARKRLGFDDMSAEQFCKEAAARPDVAVTILIEGMMGGWFTGVGLPRYVGGGRRDYINARRVVNGNDQDARIAGIARGYEPRVKAWLREHGH